MEVRFVTSNPGKFSEVRELLRPAGAKVHWSRQTLPEPQADTLDEVVRAKLRAVRPYRGFTLVEDSGLFLDGLAGFPGVYSAYIYRIWKFAPILELLRKRSRRATFRTVAGVRQGRKTWIFPGESRGWIAPRPRGTHGFGFDPIFIPDGEHRTYAELTPDEKNRVSHRSRAMRKVSEFLSNA